MTHSDRILLFSDNSSPNSLSSTIINLNFGKSMRLFGVQPDTFRNYQPLSKPQCPGRGFTEKLDFHMAIVFCNSSPDPGDEASNNSATRLTASWDYCDW